MSDSMILMKFGGSTMGTSADIRHVAGVIRNNLARNPLIVVSALKGITDMLETIITQPARALDTMREVIETHTGAAAELNTECSLLNEQLDHFEKYAGELLQKKDFSAPARDHLLSFGERFSSSLMTCVLRDQGIQARTVFSDDLGFITNSKFGDAEILTEGIRQIRTNLSDRTGVPVITGFIGKNRQGLTTTVGRSGSDYTATVIGSAMGVEEVQIWTDVPGVLTADPNIVPTAGSVSDLTFEEAAELAYFGTKFLHPKCIMPAMKHNIPIRILSTKNPGNAGTVISNGRCDQDKYVKAIVYKKNLNMILIRAMETPMSYGFVVELFNIFNRYHVPVDSMATTDDMIAVTMQRNFEDEPGLFQKLETHGKISIQSDRAVVTLIGQNLQQNTQLVSHLSSLLNQSNVPVELVSRNNKHLNLSFIIDQNNIHAAVNCLHNELFEKC